MSKKNKTLPFDIKYEKRAFWYKYLKQFGFNFRFKLYRIFENNLKISPNDKLLDLGVTDIEINSFHLLYPYKNKITAAGLAKSNQLLKKNFPQIRYVRISSSFPYPFKKNQFDIVHASAVIEHVGSRFRQEAFLREVFRIGKKGVVTTPNRYFPIELHTYLPFLHWLPTNIYRKLYELLNMKVFSKEENLNLLTEKDLEKMAKRLKIKNYWIKNYKILFFDSNYLFFWNKDK